MTEPSQERQSNSFLKLILAGFTLVALPLFLALVYSAVSINRLSIQSRDAVYRAEQVAHDSRILVEQAVEMERSVRLYLILGDRSLLDAYYQAHEKFVGIVKTLSAQTLSPDQKSLLDSIDSSESGIHERIVDADNNNEKDWKVQFGPLLDSAQAFLTRGDAPIEREVEAMQAMAERARKIVFWQIVLLVPFAILLGLGFSLLISSPIRQIEGAISAIGQGTLDREVVVRGPQDLELLGERLDWMRLRLLALEEQKTLFLQNISHELKTPLTSIREGADLLAEGVLGELNDRQRNVAKILLSNSIELQKRIEDLLNYSAIQTGKSSLTWQKLGLGRILDTVLHDHSLALMNKSIEIDLSCPDISFEGDEQKIRIVVDNLLSNAIKYSPKGGRISISARSEGGKVSIEVSDSGPGIDPGDASRIFDPFYQGRVRPEGHVKGTGLGLSIAREYVREHGGNLELLDHPGSGSQFRITLPSSRIVA